MQTFVCQPVMLLKGHHQCVGASVTDAQGPAVGGIHLIQLPVIVQVRLVC